MTAPWQRSWLKSKDNPLLFVTDAAQRPTSDKFPARRSKNAASSVSKPPELRKSADRHAHFLGFCQLRLAIKNERSPQKDQPVVSAA
jgi:hypothetical protein